MSKTQVFKNIGELMTLKGVARKKGRHIQARDLGVIKQGAMVVEKGKVLWCGQEKRLPQPFKNSTSVDCGGDNVFPGFIDCHTHMIFAGDRTNEFEMRNQGVSYQEIAKKGGGILSTMKATRRASLKDLTALGQKRVESHLLQGVTSVEIKSGYGLNRKAEEKMLEAAKSLKKVRVITTFLGAHAIPKNFSGELPYLEQLRKDLVSIKEKGLSDRVDIFVEKNYFSTRAGKNFLLDAKELGFDITIHADQLSRTGATALAVDLEAMSADHGIFANLSDVKKLAKSETVAVLLPSADFYLQWKYPPARSFIDSGACVALATDFNPGSSPTQNINFVGLLARLEMKMTLPEVFSAFTYGGAKALGVEEERSVLQKGFDADFFVTNWTWKQFFYDLSNPEKLQTWVGGKKVAAKK